jgi:2-polyprenyl-3-methyl-5-hydroxy-6-metoxy-1,4-benzoquinol methylase
MSFEENYFKDRKYSAKEELVSRHVMEVLKWASKTAHTDLLNGNGKRALDVGCALGYTSRVLSDLGYETIGFDISSWGAKQAKNNSCSQFLVCDVQVALPLASDSFDLVTCFDVLEHLACPEKALRNMCDVSKGTVVCTTPNKKVEKIIRKLLWDYDETHINVKTLAAWRKILAGTIGEGFILGSFYDIAFRLGGRLFFKSIRITTYGLTVRIVIKKQR